MAQAITNKQLFEEIKILQQNVERISTLLHEGELSTYAKKELENARKQSKSTYTPLNKI